jgi:hypothetical protein
MIDTEAAEYPNSVAVPSFRQMVGKPEPWGDIDPASISSSRNPCHRSSCIFPPLLVRAVALIHEIKTVSFPSLGVAPSIYVFLNFVDRQIRSSGKDPDLPIIYIHKTSVFEPPPMSPIIITVLAPDEALQ